LLNLNGEVVGVNFAIESSAGVNSGVGFAIPVQIVERVVPELINDGEFEYAYLGLSGSTISPSVAKQLELPGNRLGVYVAAIVDGGPSADAGLQGATRTIETETGEFQVGGDIIIAIDDSPVVRFEDLVSYLVTKAAPGQEVELTILRDGKEMTVPVTLGKRPSQLGAVTSASRAREVNARDAINIALEQVQDDNLLQGEIGTKIATPDTRDGVDVWVVELSGEDQTATVVVEKATGDVLEVIVE
ncbi:MAG: PDZ domain-containing protein, partial [Caldilineaceae bacterium]|nr:PDZ domain-containing protein [Caldilineaceae bacterium]